MTQGQITGEVTRRRFSNSPLFLFGISLLLLVFPCISAHSQNTPAERNEAVPLRLRLIVSEPSVCAKASISLELELQNVSAHRVMVDPKGLFYQVDFSSQHGGKGATHEAWGRAKSVGFIALAPGESYRKSVPYSLDDGFFSSAGIYTVELSYGQFVQPSAGLPDLYRGAIDSNAVLFEVRDCSNSSQ